MPDRINEKMIVSVIVDSREPDWVQRLTFGGVPVAVAPLDAGDLLVATGDNALLVIERKTPDDFLNSLKDNRLFGQVTRMLKVSQWSYVIIQGNVTNVANRVVTDRRTTGWGWPSFHGALLTIQELGVRVITVGKDDFEAAVIRLAKRERGDVTIKPPRCPALLSRGEAMLATLPGIGEERVDNLLKYAGSPANALAFLTDKELRGVDGIGLATKLGIRRALKLEPHERLAVITDGSEIEKMKGA